MPFGDINEQESPSRFPYSMGEYQFSFLSYNNNAIHSFGPTIIPLIRYSGSSFEEDLNYIPPCSSLRSHPVLAELYKDVQASLPTFRKRYLNFSKNQISPIN